MAEMTQPVHFGVVPFCEKTLFKVIEHEITSIIIYLN